MLYRIGMYIINFILSLLLILLPTKPINSRISKIDINYEETCSWWEKASIQAKKIFLLMENIKTYDLNDAVINNKRTTYYNYRPNHCNRLTFAHLPYYAPWKIIIQASVFMHRYEWMNETSNFYSIDYLFINLTAYFLCNHPDQHGIVW